MALTFTATPHLKKSIAMIDNLDSTKFPLLLSRIVQKVHLKDEAPFSEEELEKLQKALAVTRSDLKDIIEMCEFIFHQAAYHSAKPAVLQHQLQLLELSEEKVNTFVDVWSKSARDLTLKLRQHTLPPAQLEAVNWRLCLGMSQQTQKHVKNPTALVQLKISDGAACTSNNVDIEFSHSDLYKLYNQLETIQSQLDSLS